MGTKKQIYWVVDQRHDHSSDPTYSVRETYDEAVDVAHKYFLSYDFELRDGKPFDSGNDYGDQGGFDVFDNVKMHKGKVAEFMHFGGDGPCCTTQKAE